MADDLPCRLFVERCAATRQDLLDLHFAVPPATLAGTIIDKLTEAGADASLVRQLVEHTLTDAFVTLLYGLSGAASLGDDQQMYDLRGEDDQSLARDSGGDLESYAYEIIASKG